MNQYKTIEDALKDLVPKKGKSNAEVGRKLGDVSGQLLGQYISGSKKPKTEFYTKWKKAFNEDLFSMIETNVSREPYQTIKIPDAIQYLAERVTLIEAGMEVERSILIDLLARATGKTTTEISTEVAKALDYQISKRKDELQKQYA